MCHLAQAPPVVDRGDMHTASCSAGPGGFSGLSEDGVMVLGTPEWMAPEMFTKGNRDKPVRAATPSPPVQLPWRTQRHCAGCSATCSGPCQSFAPAKRSTTQTTLRAPHRALHQRQVDVFSFGILMWEVLSRKCACAPAAQPAAAAAAAAAHTAPRPHTSRHGSATLSGGRRGVMTRAQDTYLL